MKTGQIIKLKTDIGINRANLVDIEYEILAIVENAICLKAVGGFTSLSPVTWFDERDVYEATQNH